MPLQPITQVKGRAVVVAGDDIDTDRIIPARYLRAITFDGMGEGLFYDVRFDEHGRPTGHPLDAPERAGAKVMISGSNFGCGSSREHAPQAIVRAGFQAVVAGSFAEIFFGNATTLGMPCIALPADELAELSAMAEADPGLELVIDIAAQTVSAGGRSFKGRLPDTARDALLSGRYDPLAELLENADAIDRTATALPYTHTGGHSGASSGDAVHAGSEVPAT